MQMGRVILVLLVQVDILKTTVLVGMLVQEIRRTVIKKDGLHATIWATWLERLIRALLVLQVKVRQIAMGM
jgi:hypothetical protein